MNLIALHVYPVKSMRGIDLPASTVEARGLAGDRRWMLIDASGNFVTARQVPQLLRFAAEPIRGGLILFAPDGSTHDVAEPAVTQPTREVSIWRERCTAREADAISSDWLSERLGQSVRLVHMGDDCIRPVSPEFATPGDVVGFADGFPLLLIGTASLDALNARLSNPVTMTNFRPNLVIATDTPHIEDQWRRIRIGDCEFDVVKPCSRCVLTTIDPDTAAPAPDGEPLATLKTYRRSPNGVTFGQNIIPRLTGVMATGMSVRVLE